jgi:hypothetical protein
MILKKREGKKMKSFRNHPQNSSSCALLEPGRGEAFMFASADAMYTLVIANGRVLSLMETPVYPQKKGKTQRVK